MWVLHGAFVQACQISVGGSFFKGSVISIVSPLSSGILECIRCWNVGSDEVKLIDFDSLL